MSAIPREIGRTGGSPARRGPARVLALLAALPAVLGAQAAEPLRRVDYRIEARLEGATDEPKTMSGSLELTWANPTADPVPDLWFHLYLNAFSNNRSSHLAATGGRLRGVAIDDGWGWIEVTALRVTMPGGTAPADLLPTLQYRRPDDQREDDRTVFSVDLPRPLGPGEEVRVEVDWLSQLPRVRRRTGAKGDFLLVAQWFPKLGVYEQGRGWNCHQFHRDTEFYSDYGTYDVTLDLPARFEGKVGGTGKKELELQQGDRVVVRFAAPSTPDRHRVDAFGKQPLVHDFAWTADPRYVVQPYTFRYGDWAEAYREEVERVQRILGPEDTVAMRDVDVTVLIHPERAADGQAQRHFEATSAALFFYGLWFGEYPYQHVTVVDPAWGAGAAGGMEYPTLFTCGTDLYTTEDMHRPESVTVHEAGHQFWYGLVGTNEFEAAWMDEGFNSYTDAEVLWRVYGPSAGTTVYARRFVRGKPVAGQPGGGGFADVLAARSIPIALPFVDDLELQPLRDFALLDPWEARPSQRSLGFVSWWRDQPRFTFVQEWSDPRWEDRSGYLADPASDPIDTEGWRYVDRTSYRTNSYPRTAVALRTLSWLVGPEAFLRGMRHYARTWRYRHPYPDDFFRTFQEGAGVDVQWYFDEVFRGTRTLDWSVEVDQSRRPLPRGVFQSEGGRFLERPKNEDEDQEQQPWQTEVVLRTKGGLHLPVVARLTFADGTVRDEPWPREEQVASTWKRIRLEGDSKLVSVVLDPGRGCFLDADMSDNQWYDETDGLTPWRWGERVLAQYQRYFHWVAGIGG